MYFKSKQLDDFAKQLNEMAKADQEMRDMYFQAVTEGKPDLYYFDPNLDQKHAEELKSIIAEIGWPTISKVGDEASENAWLIAQHADHDLEFQQTCLKLMGEAKDDVSAKRLASLSDRVAVKLKKPQTYGTQFKNNPDGTLELGDVIEPEKLDERRAAVGLEPFAEYLAKANTIYSN